MLRIRIIEASCYFELLRNAEQHSIIGKGVSTHRPRDSTHTSDSAGLLNIWANLFAIALLLAHHLPQPQSISLSSFSSHTFGCWPRIWFLAPAMARSTHPALLVLLSLLFPILTLGLKFDLVAQPGHSAKNERCIRNFVNRDTLVVVTATVSGSRGDGQMVNMHVCRVPNCSQGEKMRFCLKASSGRYHE